MNKIELKEECLFNFPKWCPLNENEKIEQKMCCLCKNYSLFEDGLMKCKIIDEIIFR